MELKDQNPSKKSRKVSISVVLYVVASVIALIGVALLIDNIYIFRNTVNQYVAKKIPIATVLNQLIPQFLPQIFEPIAVYGGIACVLLGVGKLNKKVSKCLMLLTRTDACDENIEEGTLKRMENAKSTESIETVEI